ncbi:MAG: FtsX-like permease family protein, partial [Clostridia bacterium]|nr:FtsX-like permease family protein [Clostridia bacterium]
MKLTQFRDCLKNIFKQKISFISIIIIAMLGTASYVGIDYTSNTLRLNGTAVYNEANFRDIESVSTLLFASSDLDDIKALKGVEDAEAVRMAKAKVEKGKEKRNIEVVSVTERINLASVIEGQLPQTAGECAVEKQLADAMGLKVGDTISITGADGGNAQFLAVKDFSISGIVKHPDHTNLVTPDLPYALVLWEAFNEETLGGCYMKTEIVIKDPPNSNRFSKRYTKTVAKVLSRVEELGKTDSQKRQDEVYKVFTAELASNEQKLAKARQELDEARQKLADGRAQLKSGFSQLEDAKATIRDLIRTAYESAFPDDLAITRVEWAERQTTDPDNPNATARYLWITADYRINLSRIPGDIVNDIVNAKSIPEQFLCEIYKLAVSEELPVADGQTDMSAVRTGLADALTSAGSSFMKLFGAVEEWDSGHEAYLEGKAEYESGLEKYEQGQKQLESAKKQLDEQDKCRWISYDVRGNASFVQLTNGSGNFSSLKITFSMLFVLVGALVIFATVGKIVDEQRTLVGTTKALGLFPREIFLKYLGFSVSATVIGTVLGVLAGAFGVQPFLLRSFGQYYIYDLSRPLFFILPALIALLAGLTLSVFATWIACRHLLKDPAVALMQPKAPGVKKGTGGKRTFLPLYSRLILMNMRTDIKRVIVTIVSIMGCCMLILIGFTLRTAITSTTVRQFDEI